MSKNSILTKPQHFHEFFTYFFFDNFSREIKVVNGWKFQNRCIFTSFSPNFFLTIFLVNSKLSTAKKSKTTTFSRVFHSKFFGQCFSWNQSCQQLKSPKPQHFHDFFSQNFFVNFSLEINCILKVHHFPRHKSDTRIASVLPFFSLFER